MISCSLLRNKPLLKKALEENNCFLLLRNSNGKKLLSPFQKGDNTTVVSLGSIPIPLNPFSLETPKRANSAEPDQTPQYAASDQGLHCLKILKPYFSRNI